MAPSRRGFIQFAAIGGFFTPLARTARAETAKVEARRFVTDPLTGLAIFGYDPVAYAIEGAARRGAEAYGARWSGSLWQFRNASNRAEFLKYPEVYAPRYGGYDPIAVARAAPRPGHPEVFAIFAGRLYLFGDAAARTAFLTAPQAAIARADAGWPALIQALPD